MPASFLTQTTNGAPLKPTANTWTDLHVPGSGKDEVMVYASFDADAAKPAQIRCGTSGNPLQVQVNASGQKAFAPIVVTGASQKIQCFSEDGKAAFHGDYVQTG